MTDAADRYHNKAQQRLLLVIRALFPHVVTGLALKEIAEDIECSVSLTYGDLVNLKTAGIAQQMENKRWRLTPIFPQLALNMLATIDREARRLDETKQRYTRTR